MAQIISKLRGYKHIYATTDPFVVVVEFRSWWGILTGNFLRRWIVDARIPESKASCDSELAFHVPIRDIENGRSQRARNELSDWWTAQRLAQLSSVSKLNDASSAKQARAPTVPETGPSPLPPPSTLQPPPPPQSPVRAADCPLPGTTGTTDAVVTTTLPERGNMLAPGQPLAQEGMNWFVLRVVSNKENYVRDTILKKIETEGLKHLVGRILVPTERIKTVKNGKAKIIENKLYPGYAFVEMRLEPDGRIPQNVSFLIKETPGVGDFVGAAGRPTKLKDAEVEKMLLDRRHPEELLGVEIVFERGEHVVIKEGPFEGYEGTVDELLPEKSLVRVLITIFDRQVPIEVEHWKVRKADDQ